jgi:hypothetical protein
MSKNSGMKCLGMDELNHLLLAMAATAEVWRWLPINHRAILQASLRANRQATLTPGLAALQAETGFRGANRQATLTPGLAALQAETGFRGFIDATSFHYHEGC